jgi:hypothetical protein
LAIRKVLFDMMIIEMRSTCLKIPMNHDHSNFQTSKLHLKDHHSFLNPFREQRQHGYRTFGNGIQNGTPALIVTNNEKTRRRTMPWSRII